MPANPNLGRVVEDMAFEVLCMATAGRAHDDIARRAGRLHQLVRTYNGSVRGGVGLIRDGVIPMQVFREYGDVWNPYGQSPVLGDDEAA